MSEPIDCVVVGGGPAGLAAAIYLARYRRSVTVIDRGASRAALIPLSRNYPGFPEGISGAELLEHMRLQAARYGAVILSGDAQAIERQDTCLLYTSDAADE